MSIFFSIPGFIVYRNIYFNAAGHMQTNIQKKVFKIGPNKNQDKCLSVI